MIKAVSIETENVNRWFISGKHKERLKKAMKKEVRTVKK